MFIRNLKLDDILSFRTSTAIELDELNILIGPNGSGKSNLIECIALLKALPGNINSFLMQSGGADSWIHQKGKSTPDKAAISCTLQVAGSTLLYKISFSSLKNSLLIRSESLNPLGTKKTTSHYFLRAGDQLSIHPRFPQTSGGKSESEMLATIGNSESTFATYRNPFDITPTIQTAQALESIRIYRRFRTSFSDGARYGISSAAPKYPLDDGGANLALTLQEMDFHGSLRKVVEYLRRLSNRFEDIKIRLESGLAQVYVTERNVGRISATRLSDGTLKFLCLMAVLCDHDPPPLVCIEEPEIGLHPDALRLVAEALKEASSRMQIVVTTHSDALVDYFSDEPEAILVCERDTDESTCFKRLSTDELREWLHDYTLGDLWRRGHIGGTLE